MHHHRSRLLYHCTFPTSRPAEKPFKVGCLVLREKNRLLNRLCTEKYFQFSVCGCLCWQMSLWFGDVFARPLTRALWVKVGTEGKEGAGCYRTWRWWHPGIRDTAKRKLLSKADMQTAGSGVIYIDLCSVCTHTTQLCMHEEDLHNTCTLRCRLQHEERRWFSLFYDFYVFEQTVWLRKRKCLHGLQQSTGSDVRNGRCIVLACMHRLYIWPQVFDMSPLIFHMCCLSIYTLRGKPCRTCRACTTSFLR